MTNTDTIKALRDALIEAAQNLPDSYVSVLGKIRHVLALTADASEDAPTWTCFHCSESFNTPEAARLHFGKSERQGPVCEVDAAKYREMEQRVTECAEEDSGLHRQMYAMASKHAQDLRREEEKGYARALKDTGYVDPAARPAPVGAGMADAGRVMMSAHALCPTEQSHPDRMRWMADYFLKRCSAAAPAALASSTPLCPARKVECGTAPQAWCATCPEWDKARSSPMAVPFDEQKLLQLFSTWECLQRGEKGKAAWEAIIAHIKDFRDGDATDDAGGAVYFVQHQGKLACRDWTEVLPDNFESFLGAAFNTRILYTHPAAEQAKPEAVEQAGGVDGASIDTPEFRQMLAAFRAATTSAAWSWSTSHANKLINHIDAWGVHIATQTGQQAGAADGERLEWLYQSNMKPFIAPIMTKAKWLAAIDGEIAASATHKGEENG